MAALQCTKNTTCGWEYLEKEELKNVERLTQNVLLRTEYTSCRLLVEEATREKMGDPYFYIMYPANFITLKLVGWLSYMKSNKEIEWKSLGNM